MKWQQNMVMSENLQEHFSTPLLSWFDQHGRKDLPWQHPRSAYRVWISEIMLQQTQVQTVIPYFNRFILRFPDVTSLAKAPEDDVMALWSGLGYYSRARNIHKTAQIIYRDYGREFPQEADELIRLPGIGPSTAAAISSQAFGRKAAILDGNVKRVLARYFLVDGWPEKSLVKKRLQQLAFSCMPDQRCADYTQAIMDLGATCCTLKNPHCDHCPLQKTCLAFLANETQNYPVKKIKKERPVQHQQFLLLYRSDQHVYLEKNPPTGLWCSLWCLPSLNIDHDPAAYLDRNFGFQNPCIEDFMTIKHSFSHFHLHIKARLVKTMLADTPVIRETTGKWFKLAETSRLALAKPTRDILNQLLVLQW
ncbi:A/G-specific adenine glycosylase [Legionella spiritensis]|uniref:Adenine DNA glycosylase n=2 Tax=Legionella spiritensis TaxID=452 RepID=A0A0W0Z2H7_LEGSP|nr:A/G-specific adenine glycosylase [Legionella spiritensis]KTD63357.1 A/G specific adenine glycosylase [Legionella spiritensis]SNV35381.1 A/G-specific adenine glycosylase [Legionella spiritensis]